MRRLLLLLALAAPTGCCARIDFQQDITRNVDIEQRGTDRDSNTRGLTRFLYAACLWPQETP